MNDQEKASIAETLKTPGWALIAAIIEQEIVDVRLVKRVDRKKRFEDIAIESISRGLASEKMEKLLQDIQKIHHDPKAPPKSWA